MGIIFGPINSRRFGKSLGVDLSPNIKQCNFDCLYCELKAAKVVDNQSNTVSVSEVLNEIKNALANHKDIDVLTLTANGEPTLYPYLSDLIDEINKIKGGVKTLILTNSSTIDKLEIQEALAKLDSVKLSLDCASKKCFKKLDRASKSIDLESIKRGILEFKNNFDGDLLIEILFVKGINDSSEEIAKLNQFLLKLKPTRVDIGTIDRPPAYDIKPISYDRLHELSLGFDKSLNIAIATKQPNKKAKFDYSNEEILKTLSLRPLTKEDIETLFNEASIERLNELEAKGSINRELRGGVEFYIVKEI